MHVYIYIFFFFKLWDMAKKKKTLPIFIKKRSQ